MGKDIILIIVSIAFGVIIGEPLKSLVTGEYFRNRENKQNEDLKVRIFEEIHSNSNKVYTTESLYEVFKEGELSLLQMFDLLEALELEGRIRKVRADGLDYKEQIWVSNL